MTKDKKCPACGLKLVNHPGVLYTCQSLGQAREALKAIQIWAMTPGALKPKDVIDICRRTLTETQCKEI